MKRIAWVHPKLSQQLSGMWSVGHRPRQASLGWCPTSQRQFGMHPIGTKSTWSQGFYLDLKKHSPCHFKTKQF